MTEAKWDLSADRKTPFFAFKSGSFQGNIFLAGIVTNKKMLQMYISTYIKVSIVISVSVATHPQSLRTFTLFQRNKKRSDGSHRMHT